MSRAHVFLCLLLSVSTLARADGVSPGPTVLIFQLQNGLVSVSPEAASLPSGHSLIAWEESFGASKAVRYLLFDPQGNVLSGILSLPGLYAGRFRVTAGRSLFMLTWEEWATPSAQQRDVHYRMVNIWGTTIAGGQANNPSTSILYDESGCSCSANINDVFVISWIRQSLIASQPTAGVYLRRIASNGVPMEPVPNRADAPAGNFGVQNSTACTIWPSGRILIVWVDGTPGSTSGPDGDGTGILGRWFNADLTPATGHLLAAGNMTGDQSAPRLAANHRNEAVLGLTSNGGGFLDVFVHRLTDSGQTFDVNSVGLTTGTIGNHVLHGVGMAPNGDHVVTWLDSPPVPGGAGARVAFARLSSPWGFSTGAVIETGLVDAAPGSGQTQGLPAPTIDPFGNFASVWPRETAGQWELVQRTFKRNMITFSNPAPAPGTLVSAILDSPSDPGYPYFLFLSLGRGPIYVDTREVLLTFDAVTLFGLQGPASGAFNFAGGLDPSGFSADPVLQLPNTPIISGLPVNFAFVTLDPWGVSPSGINTVSDTYTLHIQ